MFFESHAHYDDERYGDDRDALLAALPEQGIDYVVNAGADMASSRAGVELARRYDFIYNSVGVHPHEVKNMTEADIAELARLCSLPKTVALGEIGLDFYYDNSPRDVQRHWFARQLELCGRVGLPVIVHSRDAAAETFDIIKASNVRRGVIHCYSGSAQMAREYVKLGFFIGIGGVVTFPKARNIVETVETLGLENILLETDCPYLSPVPKRGERNSSLNLKYIAERIAGIKGVGVEEVARVTLGNAVGLFGLAAHG
jgi:TatD DNase family protein